jgi:predicted metal-dependent RNase
LGFSGHAERVRLVQILETFRGQLTICHLIRGDIQKATVDLPQNLDRWRFQLATGAR